MILIDNYRYLLMFSSIIISISLHDSFSLYIHPQNMIANKNSIATNNKYISFRCNIKHRHISPNSRSAWPFGLFSSKLKSSETSDDSSDYDHNDLKFDPYTNIEIPIIYENENIIVINKPHGISHHNDPLIYEPGLLSIIRYLQSLEKFPYKGRIYGVHRLDKVTSGILILAKNEQVASQLTLMFQKGEITKYYIALSNKKPKKKKQGWVIGDMVKGRRSAWKLVPNGDGSNTAKTRFYTAGLGSLKNIDIPASFESRNETITIPKTLILFEPHTGKTHQLRVASKSLGIPIVGDELYSEKKSHRVYLHAIALSMSLDGNCGEKISMYCPPPQSWFHAFWSMEDDDHGKSNTNDGSETCNETLESLIVNLMKKHCSCDSILKLLPS